MNAIQQFENVCGVKITKKKHIEILLFLVCLEIVVSLSYIGFIQIAPISVTTLHILVIVAAMYFGPWDAAIIAGIFAFTSIWKANFTSIEAGDIIFSPFISGKPLESIVMSVGARLVFGILTGFAFRLYFSKIKKLPYLFVSLISLIGTGIHSLLVYICMVLFFDANSAQTSSSFSATLIWNNLLLYTITVGVVILFYKIPSFKVIKNFFEKVSINESQTTKKINGLEIGFYLSLVVISILICLHFISRLTLYIEEKGENVSSGYIEWTQALVIQFIVGFVGLFGIIFLFIRWIQQYYSALTVEANIRARENAEIANKSKSTFLFNMSHDIRTPMNAILGYTDIALKHEDNQKKVKESLQKIKVSSGHLLNLINDILEMSRIESGKLELAENIILIDQNIEAVVQMCYALTAPKDIEFKHSFNNIKNNYVYGDELHINEILINLISNATKYTHNGGLVELICSQLNDPIDGKATYQFVVKDNGIGMSKEFQEHLFENFARENNPEVNKQEGTGIGLSIVKRILDIANGSIKVESEQGKGSTFIIEIPLKVLNNDEIAEYKKTQVVDENIENDVSFEGKRALLVEDNELNREIAREILEEQKIIVKDAVDGENALEILAKSSVDKFDFILMDIQMPGMNGYEATKKIRELYPNSKIPIIALSANAFSEDKEASIAAGMNDHVSKPINIKELFDCLKKHF